MSSFHSGCLSTNLTKLYSRLHSDLREEFKVTPSDVGTALGETAVLRCEPPAGVPRPTVVWLKEGSPVSFVSLQRRAAFAAKDYQKNWLQRGVDYQFFLKCSIKKLEPVLEMKVPAFPKNATERRRVDESGREPSSEARRERQRVRRRRRRRLSLCLIVKP